MENELEEGSVQLAETLIKNITGQDQMVFRNMDLVMLQVGCSIAISLKKIAEEANTATANIGVGEIKQK